jgi:hypothetical protein
MRCGIICGDTIKLWFKISLKMNKSVFDYSYSEFQKNPCPYTEVVHFN